MAQVRTSKAILTLTSDLVTPPLDVRALRFGTIQATWDSLVNLDATMRVQVSVNSVDWNDSNAPDNEATLSSVADTQIWELLEVTAPYVRIAYKANTNTGGNAVILFEFTDRGQL